MKRVVFIFSVAISIHWSAMAQPIGYKLVEDITAFKSKFAEEGKKVMAIRCNFVQEKNLSLLEEKIISEGKFWYKREKQVRLEYQKPFRYLMMMNGEQMVVRDEQKESRVSTHANKLIQQINRIMVDCVNGSILENKDFTSRVYQSEKSFLLIMTPTAKAMRDFFQSIQVLVDKNDWSVLGITLNEPGGDNTIMRFSDKVYNEKLDDSLFVP